MASAPAPSRRTTSRPTSARRAHWQATWHGRDPDTVTWFQAFPERSLRLVTGVADPSDAIIDVGGGASRVVDALVAAGYDDVTVLDIADEPLVAARARLGDQGAHVAWLVADVLDATLDREYAVWHDRAVFHFLLDAVDRAAYVAQAAAHVPPGGHLVIATFGPDGPDRCSGLPVQRYDEDSMTAALAPAFTPVTFELEEHLAPSGVTQQFLYGVFRRASGGLTARPPGA